MQGSDFAGAAHDCLKPLLEVQTAVADLIKLEACPHSCELQCSWGFEQMR